VSDPIADKASTVFQKLAPNTTLPGVFISGNTVEAMVGELIKPMLKDWLDANLPRIVEEKVEAEVARIARRSF
jgi:cell pole-organizing protein PopZ